MQNIIQRNHAAARITGILAVIFGVLFDYFFFEKMPGISVSLYFFLLIGVIVALHLGFSKRKLDDLWLAIPALFFASMVAVRASGFLTFLNVAAALGLTFLMVKNAIGFRTKFLTLRDYVVAAINIPFDFLASEFSFLKSLSNSSSTLTQNGNASRVFTGFLIAAPLLIIFTILFSTADPVFSGYVHSIFSFSIPEVWIGKVILFFISAAVVSVTFWSLITSTHINEARVEGAESAVLSRSVEIATFLGSIATLFLFFILFQLKYLFGGESNILSTDVTYAEYARHGFWELLAVAVITLVVLVAGEKISDYTKSLRRAFVMPAAFIVAEVFVIMISAFKRLHLYVYTYGETALRFYVASFILFLFVIFGILLYKIIRAKQESFFVYGTLLSLIGAMIVFNFINPEAFIARKNFALYEKTGKIDVGYLGTLSADAVPVILEKIDTLKAEDKNLLLQSLRSTMEKNSGRPWQSYNFSRSKAQELLLIAP